MRADIVRAESEGHLVVLKSQIEAIVDTLAVVAFVLLVETERLITLGQGRPDFCQTGGLEGLCIYVNEELDLDVVGLVSVDCPAFTVASSLPEASQALSFISASASDTFL